MVISVTSVLGARELEDPKFTKLEIGNWIPISIFHDPKLGIGLPLSGKLGNPKLEIGNWELVGDRTFEFKIGNWIPRLGQHQKFTKLEIGN